jgi:hypothetical protein
MRTRSIILGVLFAGVLAGCGDNQSADRTAMENKFEKISYDIANLETVTSAYNEAHFEQETRKYIALVRKYADTLGAKEAKGRLEQKANELTGYCLPCVSLLADEAKKY